MKTKTKIVKSFLELNKAMTIKDISRMIEADYRITHVAVQRLLENDVLSTTKVGSAKLCQLNLHNYGVEIIKAEDERKKRLLEDKNLKQLHKDILTKLETTMYVLLYTQSGIPGINLTFISNENNFKKKIENVLNQIPLQIHAEVFTETEFKEVKHKYQKNIILHNVESYYLLKSTY